MANVIEELREENLELQEKIKGLNEKIIESHEGYSMSQDHQGNGLEGCEQFTKNLTYGNLQAHEQEQKQVQLIKMLDLQCENEKLNWKISIQEVDISIMVEKLQNYMKTEEEQGDIKEKLKNTESQLQTHKEALQKAKEDIITS